MSSSWDMFFKVAGLVAGLVVVPTFAWVWHTNSVVQQLEIELNHAKEDVERMNSNTVDIQLIKKDIEYIKKNISDVKVLLESGD